MKDCRKLYGCIYRNLLYYINGKENVVKFHATPRLYASGSNRFAFVGPIRILVIGAACSGATTLCRRIAREFSMAHLNSDSYFPEQRESGFKRRTLSQEFQRARVSQQSSIDLVTLVECLHLHRNDCPNGMVLDNFPITPKDLIDAAQENIGFHIVLIIKTDFSTVWRNWKTAYQQTEPQTMVNLIYELSILYKKFQRYAKILKRYETPQRDLDLFNIVYLKRTVSKWAQWEDAKSEILLCLREIGSYKKKLLNQECVGISRFNIFRKEYERRLSPTKMYCPICLKADGKLVMYRHDYHSVDAKFYSPACQRIINEPFGYNIYYLRNKHGFPKPYKVNISYPPIFSKNMFKTNLVQYLNHFYWTCDQHHLDVLLNSENHLPPSTLSYPPYLPFLVTNYFQKNIANEGFCVVTYHENLPKEIYIPGNPNYAVYYRGNVYLSASADCALQFLENPSLYYRVKMPPYTEPYLNVELKDMQIDFGPLTPQIIIEALTALAEHRPKHLALSIADSAAVFIGLYLKTINPISKSESLKLSEELYSKYIGECSYLKWLIDQFQQKINPYVAQ
ncbi:uncharacterized protein LOC119649600 [Hermetia illucens]|nr:uncharacterized protein LOC119649600 [Hermetia illucens]